MFKKVFLSSFLLTLSFMIHGDTPLPKTSEPIQKVTPLDIKHEPFKTGALTVICGAMCAGKSEEFIKQVSRFILAGFNVLVLKPSIDNRKLLNLEQDPSTYISSRNGGWINCTPVRSIEEMKKVVEKSQASVVAIDEVHFFTPEQDKLIDLIRSLVASKKKVITAGLELDFRGEAFGPMPQLLAHADNVVKLKAICNVCGEDTFCISQRLINGEPAHYNDPLIVVGSTQYEPRCRRCHTVRRD